MGWLTQQGDANDNSISGEAGQDNHLIGLGGNDRLYGANKADILEGNAGDDWLYGDDGTDTLAGSVGNDYLTGGNGDDLYLFNKGDGRDAADTLYGTSDVANRMSGLGGSVALWGGDFGVSCKRHRLPKASCALPSARYLSTQRRQNLQLVPLVTLS